MIVAGIDIGGTDTKAVLMKDRKIISRYSLSGTTEMTARECLSKALEKAGIKITGLDKIAATGGGARKLGKAVFSKGFELKDEIKSIGLGGMHLSGKKSVFIACVGTGTAFVSVKGGRIEHLGGSGVGGGTLFGLSKLILDKSIEEAEKIAMNGSRQNIDMTVNDIIGMDLCKIPKDATASNFGKLEEGYNDSDIALSILNMIAETIGVMSYFAAKSCGLENDIIFCGRVSLNPCIKERLGETIRIFGGRALFPDDAGYCGAIGAVLSFY